MYLNVQDGYLPTLSAQKVCAGSSTWMRSLDRPHPPLKSVNIMRASDTLRELAEHHYHYHHYYCTFPSWVIKRVLGRMYRLVGFLWAWRLGGEALIRVGLGSPLGGRCLFKLL